MLKTKNIIIVSVVLGITSYTAEANNDQEFHANWHCLDDDCFYISLDTERKSWKDAESFCTSKEASLAQPTTANQVQALAGLLEDEGISHFWVGARNQNTTSYRWLNGNLVTAGWVENESIINSSWRGVAIDRNGGSLKSWIDTNPWRFICQISDPSIIANPSKNKSITATTTNENVLELDTEQNVVTETVGQPIILPESVTDPIILPEPLPTSNVVAEPMVQPGPSVCPETHFDTNASVSGCPTDWQNLNNGCYCISTEKKTWDDAKTFCDALLNGTREVSLAQPTTAKYVQALAGLIKDSSSHWVGARTRGYHNYRWLSSDHQITGGWRRNQPSLSYDERCVGIVHSDNNDTGLEGLDCNNEIRKFICQLPDLPTTDMPTETFISTGIIWSIMVGTVAVILLLFSLFYLIRRHHRLRPVSSSENIQEGNAHGMSHGSSVHTITENLDLRPTDGATLSPRFY